MATRPASAKSASAQPRPFLSAEWFRGLFGLPPTPGFILVNGLLVPAPCRGSLVPRERYWVVTLVDHDPIHASAWGGTSMELQWLSRGLVHLTKEAALIHAHALLAASEVRS